VAVSVEVKTRHGRSLLVSNITVGSSWYGTVTITQGTAKSEANVVWALTGNYQGLETYEPTGTVHYTPETDYGPSCSFVSMNPVNASITRIRILGLCSSTGTARRPKPTGSARSP
jgi:hypothetical protein